MTTQIDRLCNPHFSFGLTVDRLLTKGSKGLVVQIDYTAELFAKQFNLTGKYHFSWKPRVVNPTVDPEIPYADLSEDACVEWLNTYDRRTMMAAVQKAREDVDRQRAEAEAAKDKPKAAPLPWG